LETSACVFHIDIDAFFASVEQLRNPRLAERPVAVGAGVIASCSYEARRFGLSAGMPLGEATKRCPDLVILAGHYPIYRCFAEQVFDICREYAPAIESHLDEAFCDLSGTQKLYGFELAGPTGYERPAGGRPGAPSPRIAVELKERVRKEVGLNVSLGIGRSRMVAKMASKSAKPNGLRLVGSREEDDFLRPLPVRLLPGVGPKTESLLARLNISRIEEMRALSRSSLRAMFGQNGLLLYERCRGEDTRAIGAREIPRSISRETSFHQPTTSREEIEGMLHYLTERAANTLRKLGLKTRTVEVKICYADSEFEAGGRALRRPTQLDGEIFETALALRRSLYTRRVALRLVGVTLSRLVPDDGTCMLDLFGGSQGGLEERRRELSLCRSLDRVRERFGYSAVVSGKSLHLLGKLPQDAYGYILRTPSLTR
jgi:DNA polymerase-4